MRNRKQGTTFWLSGLPSSGKTTLASLVIKDVPLIHLDSDEMRKTLTPNPCYSCEEREIVYRSIIYFCKILNNNGHNVIVSATINLRKYRTIAKKTIYRYREIYIKCPIQVCEQRDVKGLYKLSKEGRISTVPLRILGENDKYVEKHYNKSDVYEVPKNPQLILDTSTQSIEKCCEELKSYIIREII